MSFSFSIRAANRALAFNQVVIEMAKVVRDQPVHAADAPLVLATAQSYLTLMHESPDQDVCVSVHGSLSWKSVPECTSLYGVNISIGAYYTVCLAE